MRRKKTPVQVDPARMDRIVSEAQRHREQRSTQYRDRALKLFPWICGRCGREFVGKKLSELTVHHKDHNHENNPPDGSNWELLCTYCHDMEHARYLDDDGHEISTTEDRPAPTVTHRPFAVLEDLLKGKK
jgi:hypothetical protein